MFLNFLSPEEFAFPIIKFYAVITNRMRAGTQAHITQFNDEKRQQGLHFGLSEMQGLNLDSL